MPKLKLAEIDWAWFAGIFEGEGSFIFTAKNSVQLSIGMTDRDIVERCHEIAGGHINYIEPRQKNFKPAWKWTLQKSQEVVNVLDHIDSFLGNRRWARSQEARERLKKVRREGFCKYGHPMQGENILKHPGSEKTSCRTCNRRRSREHSQTHCKPKIKGLSKRCDCGKLFIARSPTHKYCDDHSKWAKRKVI